LGKITYSGTWAYMKAEQFNDPEQRWGGEVLVDKPTTSKSNKESVRNQYGTSQLACG